jgi:hypothetical protein
MSEGADDQQLRRYLLGQLAPADRESVVERLSRDELYFDSAEAVEAELRDAFVRGELKGHDRDDFERHLLRTPRQNEETVLARHLTEALDRHRMEVLDRPGPRIAMRTPRPAWWIRVAAAAMLVIAVWLGFDNRKLRQELDALRPSVPDPRATRPAPDPAPSPEIASLYLAGIVLRGSEALPELVLSPTAQLVRLEADPELDGALRAELENPSGDRVWTLALPPKTASPIRIWLPADALSAGTYTLRLTAAAPQRQALYRFRVSRASAHSPSTTKPAQ